MNELTDGLMDESPTNRLDERMDLYSLVVSFEVPEDVSVRIICVLRDAVYPDSQATVFLGTCCFENSSRFFRNVGIYVPAWRHIPADRNLDGWLDRETLSTARMQT
jgi:hypothetical protein